MPRKKHLAALLAALVVLGSLAITTPLGAAGKEKVLYRFCSANNCIDGEGPLAPVIVDKAGNLYGTTSGGGVSGYGTVFELTFNNGGWIEKVLHSFQFDGKDGFTPLAGLTFDAAGNLYGTTTSGGGDGGGTVFELTPNADGKWAEKVLHNFNGKYGSAPFSNLIMDAKGNLYGTTFRGGAISKRCPAGCGVAFELTHGESCIPMECSRSRPSWDWPRLLLSGCAPLNPSCLARFTCGDIRGRR
jgi:uncharacterized repeat protein (TIGR03803 family)